MDEFLWWRDGVIYQIYPRSFADSNGDGLGDLPGILSYLDYLSDLGVDAIWLSPIHPSPDKDFGYDISDHCAIDPRFGTLSDFDRLISECHARGIGVMVWFDHIQRTPWFKSPVQAPAIPARLVYLGPSRNGDRRFQITGSVL
jgi:alpha-glucosidase